MAAAGNDPGDLQLPANQPGVFAVGAGDPSGAVCDFSATTGLTFYAPGCVIDQITTTGETMCCGNGTSQASAFAAGVLVALRSYAPALTPDAAVQYLLSTTHNGHLDVARRVPRRRPRRDRRRRHRRDPQAARTTAARRHTAAAAGRRTTRAAPERPARDVAPRRADDHAASSIPKRVTLHAKVTFARRKTMFLATTHLRLRARTPPPRRLVLQQTRGGVKSATVTVKVSRPRR